MRTGGPARTVALRACISMRGEQRERGSSREVGTQEGMRMGEWKDAKKRDGREEVETSGAGARERGAKRLAKRDFSNFLCVLSSFPGYSAESRTGRSVLLRVVSSPIPE